ncbi:hypothetical protein [Actinoplanes lobatus]|uniref:Uncharacterized protein n=1 Tax=Actinoplanes lobatus TaxID=113568 RepID=A0A7W7HRV2_9ACTN|nr:hypothetical protein [Actinoplanes lobatus]MBB4755317.1 hypothetical protein [Actinoplanes lobatus]GIE46186.1 hypothetical protein Alo02nite_90840 [Actinoplanes lobatus]
MTPDEIRGLLGLCSAALRQPADDRDEMVWAATLGDLDFGTARAAVVDWVKTSPYWPRPADLRERARLIKAQHDRERAKRHQLDGRQAALESSERTQAAHQRTGADMVRHVLGRIADAGSNPAEGKFLDPQHAADIAEKAVEEWLDRTREAP